MLSADLHKHLVFTDRSYPSGPAIPASIVAIDRKTGAATELETMDGQVLDVSHGGGTVARIAWPDVPDRLMVCSLGRHDWREFDRFPAEGYRAVEPAVSPDGKRIALAVEREDGSDRQLRIYDARTGERRILLVQPDVPVVELQELDTAWVAARIAASVPSERGGSATTPGRVLSLSLLITAMAVAGRVLLRVAAQLVVRRL